MTEYQRTEQVFCAGIHYQQQVQMVGHDDIVTGDKMVVNRIQSSPNAFDLLTIGG